MTKAADRWQRALALKIKPDEIIGLVEQMTEQHEGGDETDFYASLGVLFERYRGKRNAADRTYCISTRMHCLSELMKSGDARLKGYTKDTNDPSCTVTHSAVFHATALCPIQHSDNRTWFDLDEFFEIALRQAESEGNA